MTADRPASRMPVATPRTFRIARMSIGIRVVSALLLVIPRSTIVSCRTLGAADLRREIGWGARVGAGGLWGGFGWLWTRRRGVVQMYVTRTDAFVWIERGRERPWLITPENPDEFVRDVVSGATSLVERGLSSKHGGAVAPNGA